MKLCIISQHRSELSDLLLDSCPGACLISQAQAAETDLDPFSSFALLCGGNKGAQALLPNLRNAVEAQIRKGKPFFSEFCQCIGEARAYEVKNTRFERPVVMGKSAVIGNLEVDIILDEQSNERLQYVAPEVTPILQYVRNPFGFYKIPEENRVKPTIEDAALFLERPNLLVCSFRMCNFSKAKFAPRKSWSVLISGIVQWLGGQCTAEDVMAYFNRVYSLRNNENAPIADCVAKAMRWFERADMLVMHNGSPYAVKEGLGAHVYPDGTHMVLSMSRPDCSGEVSLAYYLYSLLTGDRKMRKYADDLMRSVYDCQVTVPGPHYGMMRWTEVSWCACYQDDAARALMLPLLFRALIDGDRQHLPAVKASLDYLLSTTGTDGLRYYRTDYRQESADGYTYMAPAWNEEEQKWKGSNGEPGRLYTKAEIAAVPSNCPSAHYNAFYMASLLLYYWITKDKTYYDAGVKGLSTIMKHYPNTAREHSETQEYCRLILPLAILWKVTDEPDQKEWLYRVAKDLNQFRHENGGFYEWDSGQIAMCAGVKDGESSVLAENGDPVTDLLYSVNWLPLSLCVAYFVTRDEYFKEMRDYINRYMVSTQVMSDDPIIDGIWTRSLDMNEHEVYGVPNDVGWAPWSVESGWTVGEITGGLLMALLEDRIRDKF